MIVKSLTFQRLNAAEMPAYSCAGLVPDIFGWALASYPETGPESASQENRLDYTVSCIALTPLNLLPQARL